MQGRPAEWWYVDLHNVYLTMRSRNIHCNGNSIYCVLNCNCLQGTDRNDKHHKHMSSHYAQRSFQSIACSVSLFEQHTGNTKEWYLGLRERQREEKERDELI